jgi:predicted nucleic acid-binding protein
MFRSIFEKGMDNLRFAINLDGYIPEHIMDELRSEQESLNRVEDLEEKDKFNSNVEQIFSKSGPKSKLKPTYNSYNQKRKLFDDIIGYDDLKELLTKCLVVKGYRKGESGIR